MIPLTRAEFRRRLDQAYCETMKEHKMIITSITKPENATAGTLWRKEKTGEVRMADGKGGWVTPTDGALADHGLTRVDPIYEKDAKKPDGIVQTEQRELTAEEIEILQGKRGQSAEPQKSAGGYDANGSPV